MISQYSVCHIAIFNFTKKQFVYNCTKFSFLGNKKVNEEGGGNGGNGNQKPQNVVAVPKNIQRNIISRERDERRKVRRAEKPRNMMNEMVMSSMGKN